MSVSVVVTVGFTVHYIFFNILKERCGLTPGQSGINTFYHDAMH